MRGFFLSLMPRPPTTMFEHPAAVDVEAFCDAIADAEFEDLEFTDEQYARFVMWIAFIGLPDA